MSDHPVPRDEKGRFPPGVSGNPGGKLRNYVRLSHWLKVYLTEGEAGLERAPEPARKLIVDLIYSQDFRLIFDRTDGPVALKIEGLSEEDLRERIGNVLEMLRDRLPAEYHPVISEVARQALVGEGGE